MLQTQGPVGCSALGGEAQPYFSDLLKIRCSLIRWLDRKVLVSLAASLVIRAKFFDKSQTTTRMSREMNCERAENDEVHDVSGSSVV